MAVSIVLRLVKILTREISEGRIRVYWRKGERYVYDCVIERDRMVVEVLWCMGDIVFVPYAQ